MSNANKIIWFEGMFLEPQHFQQHERYIENLIQQKHRFIENNFWGFSQLTLDLDLLSIGKIGIQSAQGIFQDGTAFTIPELDHQPDPYQISEGMCNTTLYLCVPLTQQSAEVGSTESTELYRYRIKYQEIADYLVESDHKTEIQLGTLATKILSEHEDRSAYCCLPITRINETQPNHGVFFEKEFLTSYVDVHESKQLRYLIAEFHGLLNHRAEMLANRLTDAKQAGTAEMIDFLLLQLFNRYELIFHYLNDKKFLFIVMKIYLQHFNLSSVSYAKR
jgi:type VI secretion system protein ImpJ